MAEIKHCIAVLVNKEGIRNNRWKGIPKRANKSFLFNGYFVPKKCQEISNEFQDPHFDNSRGTNLPVTDAAMLGGLRTEKILRSNKK